MRFYVDRVLPRITDVALGGKDFTKLRPRVLRTGVELSEEERRSVGWLRVRAGHPEGGAGASRRTYRSRTRAAAGRWVARTAPTAAMVTAAMAAPATAAR